MSDRIKIYLAGAITHHGAPSAWRDEIALVYTAQLPHVEFINPLTVEAKTKTDAEIVALDYKWILESHAVLCNAEEPSWGTAMEIAFAYQHGVPVFAWGKYSEQASPWLRHHTDTLHLHRADALRAWLDWMTDNDHL